MNARWSDKEVIRYSKKFIRGKKTCFDMENEYGISHSTIWWVIQNRLPALDYDLYEQAMNLLKYHKSVHRRSKK